MEFKECMKIGSGHILTNRRQKVEVISPIQRKIFSLTWVH